MFFVGNFVVRLYSYCFLAHYYFTWAILTSHRTLIFSRSLTLCSSSATHSCALCWICPAALLHSFSHEYSNLELVRYCTDLPYLAHTITGDLVIPWYEAQGVWLSKKVPPVWTSLQAMWQQKSARTIMVPFLRWLQRLRGYIRKRKNSIFQDEDTLSEISHKYEETPSECGNWCGHR